MDQKNDYQKPIFIALLILSVLAVAAVLKLTSSVVLPLTIAVLASMVIEPILEKMNKVLHIPWALGIVIILVVIAILIWMIAQLVVSSVSTIVATLPKYEERFTQIYEAIAGMLDLPFDAEASVFTNLWNQMGVRSAVQNFLLSLSTGTIGFLKSFVMVLLCALFFLLEMQYLRPKLQAAFMSADAEDTKISQTRVTNMVSGIIDQVTRYISTKFFISLLTGVLVYVGLKIIGMDFAVVWAFFAFILNFIPNFGSIISVGGTTLFALLQFYPQWGLVAGVGVYMLVVNFSLGNFIEPRIQGKNLGLSPFVIIASLSLWGWIWGFAGMILGVPMMVIVKIICENFPFLRPMAILLGTYDDGSPKKRSKPVSATIKK
ncbi:MAG: AI-2E family transporter [Treponemataceae bacterium]|nr:AI-2E family transporter [Treponemataceae bacterium]